MRGLRVWNLGERSNYKVLLEEVSAEETAGKCGSNCTVLAFRKEKWSLVKARNWGVAAELDPRAVLSSWDCPCL